MKIRVSLSGRTKSFFKLFYLRQLLIPFSTVRMYYYEKDGSEYHYKDVYVSCFRVARFHVSA